VTVPHGALGALELVWEWLSLPPGNLWPGFLLLAGAVFLGELVRIALLTELTRSAIAHVAVCLLTVAAQAVGLSVVLVHAARAHPGRGVVNLLVVAAVFLVWYVAGSLTRLVRRDGEGADLGFMSLAGVIVLVAGVTAAVVW
jgi:hypothetical protein